MNEGRSLRLMGKMGVQLGTSSRGAQLAASGEAMLKIKIKDCEHTENN